MLSISSPEAVEASYGLDITPIYPIPFEGVVSTEQAVVMLLVLFIASFLIGSIPWGVIISKFVFKTDVRKAGSGNIGATNVTRTVGKKGGAAVFLLDFGKGLLSGFLGAVLAGILLRSGFANGCCALAVAFLGCVWGHVYSPWLHFKGGKGIAVGVGALFFAFGIFGALAELLLFIILVVATRYISVGSIAAAVLCPFLSIYIYWGNWLGVAFMTLGAITIIWAHRANIVRLMNGTENRIGAKKNATESFEEAIAEDDGEIEDDIPSVGDAKDGR